MTPQEVFDEYYEKKCFKKKYKIIHYEGQKDRLCANAFLPGMIQINSKWEEVLEKEEKGKDSEVKDAFIETIGHEITHKESNPILIIILILIILPIAMGIVGQIVQNMSVYFFSVTAFILSLWIIVDSRTLMFFCWVNEVHADYGGAKKGLNGDKNKSIKALKYKRQNTIAEKNKEIIEKNLVYLQKDSPEPRHPSWQQRIKMIEKGTFNSDLIHDIALETGYNTDFFIKIACDFFDPIELH